MHIFLGDVSVAFGAASICVIVIGTPSTIFNEKTFLADKKNKKYRNYPLEIIYLISILFRKYLISS